MNPNTHETHTRQRPTALRAPRTPRLSPNPRQSDQVQHDPDSWPSSSASGTTTCHLPGWPTAPTRCLPQRGSPLMPRGRDPVAPAIGLLRSSNTGSPLPGSGPDPGQTPGDQHPVQGFHHGRESRGGWPRPAHGPAPPPGACASSHAATAPPAHPALSRALDPEPGRPVGHRSKNS